MSFKFSQVSSRIQQSETTLAQGMSKAVAGEVTYIPPYKASTGSNFGIFNVANRIKTFQQVFKFTEGQTLLRVLSVRKFLPTRSFSDHGPPVFLRNPRDTAIYRGVMAFSVVGLGLTFFSIYQMASGTMKKK